MTDWANEELRTEELRILGYDVELEPGERGTVLVTCPLLPEVAEWGETIADALDQVEQAIGFAIDSRMAEDKPLLDASG